MSRVSKVLHGSVLLLYVWSYDLQDSQALGLVAIDTAVQLHDGRPLLDLVLLVLGLLAIR